MKKTPGFVDQSSIKNLKILKGHGDCVSVVPKYFKNVGRSHIAENEIFVDDKERVLAIQGHPEYSSGWSIYKGAEFFSFFKKTCADDYLKDETYLNKYKVTSDCFFLRNICNTFIRCDIV